MTNEKSAKGDLTVGNVGKKLVLFAIPVAIANLVQALYNLADMAIVGHYIGSAGMSAVTMGGQIITVVLVLATGLANGAGIYISQLYGARKQDLIPRVIGTVLVSFAVLALFFTAVILIFGKMILLALNTPKEALEYAIAYLSIYICGTIFVYIYNAFAAAIRALGRTMPAMVAVIITAVLNIALDFLFVGPFHMGVAGAAIATIISQFISMVIIAVYAKKSGIFDFAGRSFRLDWKILGIVLKIGIPQALQFGLTTLSFLLISGFVNQYGVYASAASGATSKVWSFEIIPSQAVQMAMTTLTAQNIACGQYDRIRKGLMISMGIAFCFAILFWGTGQLFPEAILSIFTSETEVISIGKLYLQTFLFCGLLESLLFCCYGLISGSGHTFFTFFCAILSAIVVRIAFVWIFDAFTNFGFLGIARAYVFAPVPSLIACIIYLISGRWKKSAVKL
ncbi:MAG: MATE family efflux transporter [Lachnospiraceae bacterium]|nr:MATE family efflux transporter [Lachnospiraceae bacterium]